jgi:hypothetical protein
MGIKAVWYGTQEEYDNIQHEKDILYIVLTDAHSSSLGVI